MLPPHSNVLIGSAADRQVFNNVPRDAGSLCAIDYNPVLNPTMPFCRSVSDDPSKWYSEVIAPQLFLSDASFDKIEFFKVSKDVARVFKEAADDLSQFAQCGYEFVKNMFDERIDVYRGIIKECPIKKSLQSIF